MLKRGLIFLFTLLLFISTVNAKTNDLDKSTIYYFHGNKRCSSCVKIEQYTKNVFDKNFTNKFNIKVVNVDLLDNKHFVSDYNLYSKSVVLVKIEDNKEIAYKNLDKIWLYLNNQEKFEAYIKSEVEDFLLK
jgi:hypothetical protein